MAQGEGYAGLMHARTLRGQHQRLRPIAPDVPKISVAIAGLPANTMESRRLLTHLAAQPSRHRSRQSIRRANGSRFAPTLP
eukprot:scaffold84408_cov33-Tisochrysis_lutea.AAC.10